MPCSDGGYSPSPATYNGLTAAQLEAALCGLMTALDQADVLGSPGRIAGNAASQALELVDWDEAGVTRKQVLTWWTTHQQADERRRASELAAERARRERESHRESGLAKLTLAERTALGIR